mgnify:FL=1
MGGGIGPRLALLRFSVSLAQTGLGHRIVLAIESRGQAAGRVEYVDFPGQFAFGKP